MKQKKLVQKNLDCLLLVGLFECRIFLFLFKLFVVVMDYFEILVCFGEFALLNLKDDVGVSLCMHIWIVTVVETVVVTVDVVRDFEA